MTIAEFRAQSRQKASGQVDKREAGKSAQAAKARKRRASPASPTEHQEQVELFRWAKQHEGKIQELRFLFAIPNGAKLPYGRDRKGQRFSREAVRLLEEGLKPGVPDIMLAFPFRGFSGLFIELKRAKKSLSKVSGDQQAWIDALAANGYRVEICYGAEAAKAAILDYLEIASKERCPVGASV